MKNSIRKEANVTYQLAELILLSQNGINLSYYACFCGVNKVYLDRTVPAFTHLFKEWRPNLATLQLSSTFVPRFNVMNSQSVQSPSLRVAAKAVNGFHYLALFTYSWCAFCSACLITLLEVL